MVKSALGKGTKRINMKHGVTVSDIRYGARLNGLHQLQAEHDNLAVAKATLRRQTRMRIQVLAIQLVEMIER